MLCIGFNMIMAVTGHWPMRQSGTNAYVSVSVSLQNTCQAYLFWLSILVDQGDWWCRISQRTTTTTTVGSTISHKIIVTRLMYWLQHDNDGHCTCTGHWSQANVLVLRSAGPEPMFMYLYLYHHQSQNICQAYSFWLSILVDQVIDVEFRNAQQQLYYCTILSGYQQQNNYHAYVLASTR
jgi:hypothetical protein